MSREDLLNFLKVVNPIFDEVPSFSDKYLVKLSTMAQRNKLLDLYLEKASSFSNSTVLRSQLIEYRARRLAFSRALKNVAQLLNSTGVNYAIFKTIKPFIQLPNDIDILIFDDLHDIIPVLKQAGYKRVRWTPIYALGMISPVSNVIIELYTEISISYIIYLDKLLFKEHVSCMAMDGLNINVLRPEAEMLCVIAHSLFKENMITLAECLDLKMRVDDLSEEQLKEFANLASKAKMDLGAYLVLEVIHTLEHGILLRNSSKVEAVCQMLRSLSRHLDWLMESYANHIVKNGYFPHKYHPIILAFLFMDRLCKSKLTRTSVATQIMKLFLASNYYREDLGALIISHLRRESY